MNKNYIKALINEMFDQNILNSEDDRADIKALIWDEGHVHDLTGDFEEDVEILKTIWIEEGPCDVAEDEEVSPADEIEEIVNSLKVGFNFVPGIGVGYCPDEGELARMKDFVRGSLAIQKIMGLW